MIKPSAPLRANEVYAHLLLQYGVSEREKSPVSQIVEKLRFFSHRVRGKKITCKILKCKYRTSEHSRTIVTTCEKGKIGRSTEKTKGTNRINIEHAFKRSKFFLLLPVPTQREWAMDSAHSFSMWHACVLWKTA